MSGVPTFNVQRLGAQLAACRKNEIRTTNTDELESRVLVLLLPARRGKRWVWMALASQALHYYYNVKRVKRWIGG
jgi:hypothetical protein